ncbi:hemagglutinin repeat-containing protein [Cupriavidus gilardii]|uniref:hemagglutinin repeat-containing protein n=1 Tax=Cupriavidus gilardii TaxID=82541 RepID=UPI0018D38922|nr:hemagglutinin repeat-containing protein [Cupriavidus gilardii]
MDGDISLHGANIKGKTVNLSAARDVNLESAQDHSSLDSHSRGQQCQHRCGRRHWRRPEWLHPRPTASR